MTKRETQKNTKAIENLLALFDTATRRRLLWQLLTRSLSGDVPGINWLMEELGKFVEAEGEKLVRKFEK